MKNKAAQEQLAAYDASLNTKNYDQQVTLTEYNMSEQVLPQVKIVTGQMIRLQHKFRPQIFRNICHISFPKLEYLNLNNNQISSIQLIRYLSCPNLKTLELYGNFITNLNPLANAIQIKSLTLISLYNNPLKEKWRVERQFMPQKNKYELDGTNKRFPRTVEDLSFLVKSRSGQIEKTYSDGKGRIYQKRLGRVFPILSREC